MAVGCALALAACSGGGVFHASQGSHHAVVVESTFSFSERTQSRSLTQQAVKLLREHGGDTVTFVPKSPRH